MRAISYRRWSFVFEGQSFVVVRSSWVVSATCASLTTARAEPVSSPRKMKLGVRYGLTDPSNEENGQPTQPAIARASGPCEDGYALDREHDDGSYGKQGRSSEIVH
jgi:hypothetical protein